MRTRKFFFNSLGAAALQIVNMFVGLILPRVVLSSFGSEINGLVTSLSQFIAYFNLVEAGLAGSIVFSLYVPLAENNTTKISAIITAAKKYYNKTGVIFLLLVFFLALFYPKFIHSLILSQKEIFLLTIVIGISGTIDFFVMAKYRALLTADQKTYVLSLATIISTILNLLLITFFSVKGFSIIFVRTIAIFSVLVRSLVLTLYTKKKYKYISFKAIPDNTALSKRWDAFYLQVLGAFQQGVPIILATCFTSLITVSIYSIYTIVIAGVKSILSIFESGTSSAFGEIIAQKDIATLQKATEEFQCGYYILITVVYSTAIISITPFIRIYTSGITDALYVDQMLAFLFVIDAFFYNIKTPQGMLVISAGLYKETKLQSSIQALIILFLGLLLTPKMGLYGILIGSLVANIYRTVDLNFFIPKKVTSLSVISTIRRQILSIIVVLTASMITIFTTLPQINNLLNWVCCSMLILTINIGIVCCLFFLFDKHYFLLLFKRIIHLIEK